MGTWGPLRVRVLVTRSVLNLLLPPKEGLHEEGLQPWACPSAGVGEMLTPSLISHLQVIPGQYSSHLSPPDQPWIPPPLTSALETPMPRSSALPYYHLRQTLGCKALSFLGWSPPSRTLESQVQGRHWTQKSGEGAKRATAHVPTL